MAWIDPEVSGQAPHITWGLGVPQLETIWCDKLRLLTICGGREFSEGVIGAGWSPWRAGRRRGHLASETRIAGELGSGVMWTERRFEGLSQTELRVEFSPFRQSPGAMAVIGTMLRGRKVWVERCDVAFDLRGVERCRLRLDPGRMKLDHIGMTPRGPETERVGFRKGSKRKAQLYDKRAERLARGVEVADPWVRFELQAWAPFDIGGESRDVLLGELGDIECPIPPDVTVRGLAGPDGFGDQRYLALASVAFLHGTRVAENAARQILGPKYRDQLRFVAFPELDPSPREVFSLKWAAEARRVLSCLGRADDAASPADERSTTNGRTNLPAPR